MDLATEHQSQRLIEDERLAIYKRTEVEAYFEPFALGGTVTITLYVMSLGKLRTIELDVDWTQRLGAYELRYHYDVARAVFSVEHRWR